MKKLKSAIEHNVILVAYHSLFHSHRYAILAWGHSAQASRAFALQRRAVKIVADVHYRADAKPIFINLSILTLFTLRLYFGMCKVCEEKHGQL